MILTAVGVNHRSASLRVRERLSVAGLELDAALAALRERVLEGFILSTCGRTEVYGLMTNATDPVALLLDVLGKGDDLTPAELRDACYVHAQANAARHALRVASGLDSMVLGEDQVQAQMKLALARGRSAGTLGPTLERVGAAALTCGKRVRTSTSLGRHALSLESLAVRAAAERVAQLGTRQVLVIGAGKSATLILRHLSNAGVSPDNVTILSRSEARATVLAAATDARARGSADLPDALAGADVVLCCTSAPHPVITPETLAPRRSARGGAPLFCVDLGMPRDVHESVAFIAGVSVVALDSLSDMAAAHRAARREQIPAAEAIVDQEVARLFEWLDARKARHQRVQTLKHRESEDIALIEETAS